LGVATPGGIFATLPRRKKNLPLEKNILLFAAVNVTRHYERRIFPKNFYSESRKGQFSSKKLRDLTIVLRKSDDAGRTRVIAKEFPPLL
jgi:hypothetical protein